MPGPQTNDQSERASASLLAGQPSAKSRVANERLADVLTATRSSGRSGKGRGPHSVPGLWASLLDRGRPARHLQSPLPSRRPIARAIWLRGRAAMRPGRKETLFPPPPRQRCVDVRHDGVRFSLFLLPELGDQPGVAGCRPVASIMTVSAAQIVAGAREHNARLVVSSYNEPLITAEWAVAVFTEAKKAGMLCAFVSNGNATPEALDFLQPWIVAYKVDLKSFDDQRYRSLGGTLAHVTETIRMAHERGPGWKWSRCSCRVSMILRPNCAPWPGFWSR